MFARHGLRICLFLVVVFFLWNEAQGRCSSCPSNGCSQTGMSQGTCYRARNHLVSYQSAYHVTNYYQTSRTESYKSRCGWFGWSRCTRYRTVYDQRGSTSVYYRTSYRNNRACDPYCCSGYLRIGTACRRVCVAPESPENGKTSATGTTEGHKATYSCSTGHVLSGSSSSTCLPTGQWSGSLPTCIGVNCTNSLAGPLNGRVEVENSQYEGIASYVCNSGYELSGSAVRQCQRDGRWSGAPPQCTDINECERATATCDPDRAHCLNRDGGYQCKCKVGYTLVGGNCIDLNECQTGQHVCNPSISLCTNGIGNYKCHCKSGFAVQGNAVNENTCEDIDECKTTQAAKCEHRCANTLGSFQCYCNEGYSLEQNKCKRDVPSCKEEQLPVPGNGTVECVERGPNDLKCTLTCKDMFKFGSSVDISPQYCRDGVWEFQKDKVEIPNCQPIKKRVLVLEGEATSNTTCLARQRFKDIRGEDAPIPAYIEAQCKAGESRRKREVADTGTLVLTFTFSEEIPFDCDDSCLDTISWTLRFKYYEAQWRIATGLALTFTDLETSEKLDITVTEELELEDENPQIKCTLGRILSQDQEVCIPCSAGSFFNNSGSKPRCDPCPLGYYQDESEQVDCKACPNGTFTTARGSKVPGECRAPCVPGTASWNGLSPCKECKKGYYQPETGAQFCHKCDFGQTTHSIGSTRKQDCSCPAGTYWNDCSEKCQCANGGTCTVDGSCICPPGVTGYNCTEQEPPCDVPTHYCMIVDSSRSVFETDGQSNLSSSIWEKEKDVIYDIVSGFAIGSHPNDSKVALVKYAANLEDQGVRLIETEITFADNTNKSSVLQTIHAMEPIPYLPGVGNGGTATPEAIQECLEIFKNESRVGVPKVIAVFTDGVTHYFKHRDSPEVAQSRLRAAVQSATDAGVINYGVVFIGNDRVEDARREATIIAQNVTERSFYGDSLDNVKSIALSALNCKIED